MSYTEGYPFKRKGIGLTKGRELDGGVVVISKVNKGRKKKERELDGVGRWYQEINPNLEGKG